MLAVLALLNLALFLLSTFAGLPPYWIISFAIYIVLYYAQYRQLEDTFEDAHRLSLDLEKFRAVLSYLERYLYSPGSRLARLCEPFWRPEERPSHLLRRLGWITAGASLRGNPFVWLGLNILVPWDLFFAEMLNRARSALHARLPAWLDAWYELEALNSLANFAALNPGAAYPELVEIGNRQVGDGDGSAPAPVFAASPATPLPEAGKCNDLRIEQPGQPSCHGP
jgi:hypothetical protein